MPIFGEAHPLPLPAPAPHPAAAEAFLGRWRPGAAVWSSPRLVTPPLEAALGRCETAIAGVRAEPAAQGRAARAMGAPAALLRRAGRVLAIDAEDARAWRRLGAPPDRLRIAGPLQSGASLPPHDERRRAATAARLAGRPVWFAVAVPPDLAIPVLAAHRAILGRAHRALLVIEPQGTLPESALAEAGFEEAHVAGARGPAVPTPDTEILIAQGPGERGLWYRAAPVALMGDSFAGLAAADPTVPAALGAAVVHGARAGALAPLYARLAGARASLPVPSPAAIGAAVESLLAPDRAAALAHAAWSVVTAGAEATDLLADWLIEALDRSEE